MARERERTLQSLYFSIPDWYQIVYFSYQYEIAYFSEWHPVIYAQVGGRSADAMSGDLQVQGDLQVYCEILLHMSSASWSA